MSADTNHNPMNIDERFNHLEQEMASNQRQIAEISSQNQKILDLLGRLSPANASDAPTEGMASAPDSEPASSFVSRRSMLRNAALATLGAAAVWDTMPSAKASNSSYLNLGTTNSSSGSTTLTSSASGDSLIVNNTGSGSAIYAMTQTATSAAAITGNSTNTPGIYGISNFDDGLSGSSATLNGVSASGGLYGGAFAGAVAALFLAPDSSLTTPYSSTLAHLVGELFVDHSGGLWFCTVPGTPGTWRKVAGPTTAGSFAVLSAPTRFIDTRPSSSSYTNTAPPAPNSVVKTYIFAGAGALTPYTPSGSAAVSIPAGATSLVGRVTVLTGQSGHTATSGQLKVSNINPPGFGSGLAIWATGSETQIIPFVLALDNTTVAGSGQAYFVNSSTTDNIDIIVDVTGYYF